jgi:hypothetical protein
MRKIIPTILTLIVILTMAVSCNQQLADPYYDYVPVAQNSAEIIEPTTTPEEIDSDNSNVLLSAIIDNLTVPLLNLNDEYNTFLSAVDIVLFYFTNPSNDNLSAAIKFCEDQKLILSEADNISNNLSSDEKAAVSDFGMSYKTYNEIFTLCARMNSVRINILQVLFDNLNNLRTYEFDLYIVTKFYSDYARLVHLDLLYDINSLINDCNVESEVITDFINNTYSEIISPFTNSGEWSSDNTAISGKKNFLNSELQALVDNFQKYSAGVIGE